MTHPLLPVFIYPFYLLFRWFVHLVRDVVWWINGTRSMLNDTRCGRDERCGHILSIRWRYRYDVITQSNKLDDFVLYHERFVSPEYVLRDEVSLYQVGAHQVVFVECGPGVSAWDLRRYSFSRECQYRQAVKVIILPTTAAIQLAAKIGHPRGKQIFVGNISRCGSTLLCRMFQSTGHYISYVEPSVLGDLSSHAQPHSSTFITMTLNLLCKQRNPAIEGHVVKISASNTAVIQSLYELFPEASYLFVYRNQLPVLKSLARIVPSLPFTHLVSLLDSISVNYAKRFTRYHSRADDLGPVDDDYHSPYRRIFPISLRPITLYYSFLQRGMDIKAVRFEDLLQDPERSMKRIFAKCNIPYSYIARALIPLDKDSQENSSLSGRKLKELRIPEFTEYDREQLEKICERNGIPNVLVHKVYPETITQSGDR